jgi:hypothetical protein
LGNAVRNGPEERSRLVQPNNPGDACLSDLERPPARPSAVHVVTPADPPLLNEAAAAALLGILIRASQDQIGDPSIAST